MVYSKWALRSCLQACRKVRNCFLPVQGVATFLQRKVWYRMPEERLLTILFTFASRHFKLFQVCLLRVFYKLRYLHHQHRHHHHNRRLRSVAMATSLVASLFLCLLYAATSNGGRKGEFHVFRCDASKAVKLIANLNSSFSLIKLSQQSYTCFLAHFKSMANGKSCVSVKITT